MDDTDMPERLGSGCGMCSRERHTVSLDRLGEIICSLEFKSHCSVTRCQVLFYSKCTAFRVESWESLIYFLDLLFIE